MARTMVRNSAGSQFFIMVADSPHLDGQYASFGKIIEGIEVADKIVCVDRDYMDKPKIESEDERGNSGYIWRRLSGTGKNVKNILNTRNRQLFRVFYYVNN